MSERIIFYLNYTENTVFRVQSTTGTMKRCVCALLRPFSWTFLSFSFLQFLKRNEGRKVWARVDRGTLNRPFFLLNILTSDCVCLCACVCVCVGGCMCLYIYVCAYVYVFRLNCPIEWIHFNERWKFIIDQEAICFVTLNVIKIHIWWHYSGPFLTILCGGRGWVSGRRDVWMWSVWEGRD